MNSADNYYIQDQLNYTKSPQTRPGWKRRYDFAIQHLSKQDIVLDCACGIGEGTHMIAQHCTKVVGMDIDTHFIDYCRAEWPNIQFICHDAARRLPFDNESFTAVVSLETLEHLPSRNMVHAALTNFHRILKPGGLLIASVPNTGHTAPPPAAQRLKLLILRLFGSVIKKQTRWHEHYHFWDAEGFERILRRHFSVVSVYGEWVEGVSQNTEGAPYLIARAKK